MDQAIYDEDRYDQVGNGRLRRSGSYRDDPYSNVEYDRQGVNGQGSYRPN